MLFIFARKTSRQKGARRNLPETRVCLVTPSLRAPSCLYVFVAKAFLRHLT